MTNWKIINKMIYFIRFNRQEIKITKEKRKIKKEAYRNMILVSNTKNHY